LKSSKDVAGRKEKWKENKNKEPPRALLTSSQPRIKTHMATAATLP
jgi:hypothetical protein